jgi:hypothetical protein
MARMRAAIQFLRAVAVSSLRGLRRIVKWLAEPGTGPFLSSV